MKASWSFTRDNKHAELRGKVNAFKERFKIQVVQVRVYQLLEIQPIFEKHNVVRILWKKKNKHLCKQESHAEYIVYVIAQKHTSIKE